MMNKLSGFEIALLFAGMTLVTYIPRMLPAILLDKIKFGPKTEKFLKLIPYTAMASLIFPAVFMIDPARPEIGIVGAIAAGVLAWRRCPLMLCVIAAIAVDFALYLLL